jgi:hypothetical protein
MLSMQVSRLVKIARFDGKRKCPSIDVLLIGNGKQRPCRSGQLFVTGTHDDTGGGAHPAAAAIPAVGSSTTITSTGSNSATMTATIQRTKRFNRTTY